MLKKFFDFFVFTSLFIAGCAVLMVAQTGLLFHFRIGPVLYAFVFFGSVCSYNFHWYLTPPNIPDASYKLRWNIQNRHLHFALFLLGVIGSGITSVLLIKQWYWLGLTALLTFLYSAPKIQHPFFIQLRKIAIGKTIFLAVAWAHVTTLLPLLLEVKRLQPQHIWFVGNRFFFIYTICIVFDRRDVKKDREAGIKSLITFLSNKGIDALFWASVAAVCATSVLLMQSFGLRQVLILLFPVALLCLLYQPSKKNSSDYLYYFVLDGLMALSALILILATFAP